MADNSKVGGYPRAMDSPHAPTAAPQPKQAFSARDRLMLVAAPLAALVLGGLLLQGGFSREVAITAGVTVWCAVWWVSEPIPIPATSLLPLVLLPTLGVLPSSAVAEAFGSPIILLLMGGFMLSTAMSRSGAHRRLALILIHAVGADSPRRVVLGFMLAAGLLSMWVSNMATTLMLVPIGLAALEGVSDRRMRTGLLLSIAYAASIGGIGTPIGTPPNLIFMQVYREYTGEAVSFLTWMGWALPIVVIMLPLSAWWLTRGVSPAQNFQIESPGPWRAEERRVLAIFAVTALCWVFRTQPFGGFGSWFGIPAVNDASIALAAVLVMFLVPNGRGERLLDWPTAVAIPWGILILFSSGLVIAKAFVATGLSATLGEALSGLNALPPLLLLLALCAAVSFLTEVTSNTATATLLMPILAAAASVGGLPLEFMMVPAVISASFAFMLPVATGPNAIVYGAGGIEIRDMVRRGFALNLLGIVVVSVVMALRLL